MATKPTTKSTHFYLDSVLLGQDSICNVTVIEKQRNVYRPETLWPFLTVITEPQISGSLSSPLTSCLQFSGQSSVHSSLFSYSCPFSSSGRKYPELCCIELFACKVSTNTAFRKRKALPLRLEQMTWNTVWVLRGFRVGNYLASSRIYYSLWLLSHILSITL